MDVNLDAIIRMHDELAAQTRQPYQIAATSLFLALCIPVVLLRIWVRKYISFTLGKDDYMMILALVCFIVYNAALMKIVENGGGTHIQYLETDIRAAIQWTVTTEVFYLVTHIFLKMSLGYFFLRVVQKKSQRLFIHATVAFSTTNNAAHVLFLIFRCGNPRFLVENQLLGRCAGSTVSVAMGYEQAAVSTITDLIFAILPVPLLWNLNMDLRSKISAGLILSMGAFGGICSIVRFLYIRNLAFGEDFFWTAVNISIWSTIELGMGIIAGSLATMRPLLKSVIRSTQTHFSNSGASSRFEKFEKSKSTWNGTGIGKETNAWSSPESQPGGFRPWDTAGETNRFVTTCQGPCKSKQTMGWVSRNVSRKTTRSKSVNASKINSTSDTLRTADQERTLIWPYDEEMGGISKVVDVEISVADAPVEESSRPSRGSRLSEEIRGLWRGRKEEESIWAPERPLPTLAPQSSADWDQMPSLEIIRSNSITSLPIRKDSEKSTQSSSPATK